MIELAWFVIGFIAGAVCMACAITVTALRNEKKRSQRSINWQKTKKKVDKDIQDEYGV